MSVDCEAKLMYGWYVEAKEIPDFRIHYENDWADLFDMSGYKVVLNGEAIDWWPDSLIVCDDGYEEPERAGWYIGMPLGNGFTKEEFVKQLDEVQAREVYKCVMGRDPDTAPEVLSFACWY